MSAIECIFFDVGGTLGEVDADLVLHPFPDSRLLLEALRAPGRRFGVLSNVPATIKSSNLLALLEAGGLADFFETALVIASSEAPKPKPDAAIYTFAASRAGVAVQDCLFVGEDIAEVIGARLAGMSAQLKPRR
jgi:HAD superfamily hydrolase (TIGR01509 family)